MKAATILPQNLLHLVHGQDYHLCLAHLINKPGMELYTDFYKGIGADESKYLIMDNGLIEGDPRPISELISKAIELNADELVLPDVFTNGPATITAVADALEYVNEHMTQHQYHKPLKFMAVAQGRTIDEWVDCALTLIDLGVDVIGVPKVLCSIAGPNGRLKALSRLCDKAPRLDVEFHLLGCWDTPLEVLAVEKAAQAGDIPLVRGTDSAIAYVYSRNNVKITDQTRPESNPIDFAKGTASILLLAENIKEWVSCAHGVHANQI